MGIPPDQRADEPFLAAFELARAELRASVFALHYYPERERYLATVARAVFWEAEGSLYVLESGAVVALMPRNG